VQAIYGHGGVREKKLYLRRQLERVTTKWAGKTVGPTKRAKTAQVGARGLLQAMVHQFASRAIHSRSGGGAPCRLARFLAACAYGSTCMVARAVEPF